MRGYLSAMLGKIFTHSLWLQQEQDSHASIWPASSVDEQTHFISSFGGPELSSTSPESIRMRLVVRLRQATFEVRSREGTYFSKTKMSRFIQQKTTDGEMLGGRIIWTIDLYIEALPILDKWRMTVLERSNPVTISSYLVQIHNISFYLVQVHQNGMVHEIKSFSWEDSSIEWKRGDTIQGNNYILCFCHHWVI